MVVFIIFIIKNISDEVIIKSLNGVKLSSLSKIDSFTSKYSNFDIFRMIEKELNIKSLNHLAIKCVKSNDLKPVYYRIIGEDKLYNECVSNLEERKVSMLGKTRETLFVKRSNELFKNELFKLLEVINSGSFDGFREIYPIDNDFSFLVRRYLNTSYDNDLDKERDLNLILLEFSRYKTFRGWFVNNFKKKDTLIKKREVVNNKKENIKKKVSTFDENMTLFEKKFSDEYDMSYDSYRTLEYNQGKSYCNDDCDDVKEEFLDEKEFNNMIDYDEEKIREEFEARKRR